VCAASLCVVPSRAGLLLPVAAPLVAVVVSSAAALVWNQLSSGNRIRRLEDEVGTIREALVRQESQVEGLEEDLEAARAAVARSTGTEEGLRAQLARARAQEAETPGRRGGGRAARRAGAAGARGAQRPAASAQRCRAGAAARGE